MKLDNNRFAVEAFFRERRKFPLVDRASANLDLNRGALFEKGQSTSGKALAFLNSNSQKERALRISITDNGIVANGQWREVEGDVDDIFADVKSAITNVFPGIKFVSIPVDYVEFDSPSAVVYAHEGGRLVSRFSQISPPPHVGYYSIESSGKPSEMVTRAGRFVEGSIYQSLDVNAFSFPLTNRYFATGVYDKASASWGDSLYEICKVAKSESFSASDLIDLMDELDCGHVTNSYERRIAIKALASASNFLTAVDRVMKTAVLLGNSERVKSFVEEIEIARLGTS